MKLTRRRIAVICVSALIVFIALGFGLGFGLSSEDEKKDLLVTPNELITLEQEFNGVAEYTGTLEKGIHYFVDSESSVDITITAVVFNDANVLLATRATVNYSSVVRGLDSKNYQIEAGSFELPAKINPRELRIMPQTIKKEFGNDNDLNVNVLDDFTGEEILVEYQRTEGETVGAYDFVDVTTSNPNFLVSINGTSGIGKFEITKRRIIVQPQVVLSKTFDNNNQYSGQLIKNRDYELIGELVGYETDISIISAIFDRANIDAMFVTAVCSDSLALRNEIYFLDTTEFIFDAEIKKRTLTVVPNFFSKEYLNPDSLFQTVQDYELAISISVTFSRENGEAVGIYNVTNAITTNSNYVLTVVNGYGMFEITRRTINVVGLYEAITKAYDANNLFSGDVLKDVHYRIEGIDEAYSHLADIIITAKHFDFVNVGSGTLIVSFAATLTLVGWEENYIISHGNFEIPATITKKAITITPNLITKTYGDADVLGLTHFDISTGDFIDINFVRTSGENVGFYNVIDATWNNKNFWIEVINGTNKFEITKRQLVITPLMVVLSKEYNANAIYYDYEFNPDPARLPQKDVHYTISNVAFGDNIDISIFGVEFNTRDVLTAHFATVYLTFSDPNYIIISDYWWSTFILSAMITPRTLEVIPPSFRKQYGDTIENLRSVFNDDELQHNLVYEIQINALFIRQAGESIGIYNIVGVVSEDPNYVLTMQLAAGTGQFIITARIVTINVLIPSVTKVYDGGHNLPLNLSKDIHYEIVNELSGEEIDIQILGTYFNSVNVDATFVTIMYSALLVGGGNYLIESTSFTISATITPRTIQIGANSFSKVYGDADPVLMQSVYSGASGEFINVEFEREAGEDADQYNLTAINYVNNNFILVFFGSTAIGKFEILRAEITIFANNAITTFNGSAQSINAPTSNPSVPLIIYYSPHGENNFTTTEPINAGIYNVRIHFMGSQNYNEQTVYRTLVIERAESIITNTTAVEFTYDGTAKLITGTLNHNETQLNFSRTSITNAGVYTITLAVMQTPNYRAAFLVIEVTIHKAIPSAVVFPAAGAITFGQYLYESELIGGSTFGVFNWITPTLRPTVLESSHIVRFTPFDISNIDWIGINFEQAINVTVNRMLINQIELPTATTIARGQTLAQSVLIYDSVYGTFAFASPGTIVEETGQHDVIFIPHDTVNFEWTFNLIQSITVGVHFVVTFMSNGGTSVSSISAAVVNQAPQTTRQDYFFEGWYLNSKLEILATFPLAVTEAMTLFAGWRSIALDFVLSDDGTYYSVRSSGVSVEVVIVPETYNGLPVTAILPNAFANNFGMRQIVIPSTIATIGANAFYNCQALVSAEFLSKVPASISFNSLPNNLIIIIPVGSELQYQEAPVWLNYISRIVTTAQAIDNFVVRGSILLRYLGTDSNVQIPNGITRIEQSAFNGNLFIKEIYIPASVEEIGDLAFFYSDNLEVISFAFGSSLRTIGSYVFFNASKLRQINLPNGLESIGERAFSGCTNLSEIVIPPSVEYVGESAFEFWQANQKIFLSSSPTTWNQKWNEACDAQII